MLKKMKTLLIILILTLPLTACFKSPEQKAYEAGMDAQKQMENIANKIQNNGKLDADDIENIQNTWEDFAELGADLELKEFEKQKSLSVPSNFPEEFVYTHNAKIVSVSKDFGISLTIKTTDKSDDVIKFYQKFAENGEWQNDGESIDSNSYSLNLSKGDEQVSIDVYFDSYSKLIEIDLNYTK